MGQSHFWCAGSVPATLPVGQKKSESTSGRPEVGQRHSWWAGSVPKATFCARVGPSFNFCQHSMPPGDFPSTLRAAGDILLTSVNYQHSPTLRVFGQPSINCHQICVWTGDILCTSASFLLRQETLCQLPLTFYAAGRSSVNFPCSRGHSINFREPSVQPGDIPSTFVNFACGREASCQHFMWAGVLPSISVNFLCGREISVNNHLLSMRPGDLLSTSIIYPWHRETFLLFSSAFREARRPSVNICLLFVPPGDTPSTSINFLASGRTSIHFCQLSMRP